MINSSYVYRFLNLPTMAAVHLKRTMNINKKVKGVFILPFKLHL